MPRCALHVFFFQAEDGIRDLYVTGVQTCALPISDGLRESQPRGEGKHARHHAGVLRAGHPISLGIAPSIQIGRASCRERGYVLVAAGSPERTAPWSSL